MGVGDKLESHIVIKCPQLLGHYLIGVRLTLEDFRK